MRKKRDLFIGMGLLLSTVHLTGATAAYLSKSTGEKNNVFTVGSVSAQITETLWDKEKALQVYPGQALQKNPAVENTGENNAYVFLEVTIPKRNISVLDSSTGKKTTKENRELFTFQANSDMWTLLKQNESSASKNYIYGYKSVLEPGEVTAPLFQELVAAAYVEGELDAEEDFEVPVTASVIQEQETNKTEGEIYQEFLKQYNADRKEGWS